MQAYPGPHLMGQRTCTCTSPRMEVRRDDVIIIIPLIANLESIHVTHRPLLKACPHWRL